MIRTLLVGVYNRTLPQFHCHHSYPDVAEPAYYLNLLHESIPPFSPPGVVTEDGNIIYKETTFSSISQVVHVVMKMCSHRLVKSDSTVLLETHRYWGVIMISFIPG